VYVNVTLSEGRTKHSIKITNRSLEGVAKFQHVGTTLTD
jgi:hypothetical protein